MLASSTTHPLPVGPIQSYHGPPPRRWYWVSVALFACALLSKALIVPLPVVLLVLDVYPLRRLGGAQGWWSPGARRVYAGKAPFDVRAAGGGVSAFVAIVRVWYLCPPLWARRISSFPG